jgi:hypothetical protein
MRCFPKHPLFSQTKKLDVDKYSNWNPTKMKRRPGRLTIKSTKSPFDHQLEDSNVEMEYTTKDKKISMAGCQ